jgi:hypothetical protein
MVKAFFRFLVLVIVSCSATLLKLANNVLCCPRGRTGSLGWGASSRTHSARCPTR